MRTYEQISDSKNILIISVSYDFAGHGFVEKKTALT